MLGTRNNTVELLVAVTSNHEMTEVVTAGMVMVVVYMLVVYTYPVEISPDKQQAEMSVLYRTAKNAKEDHVN